MLSLSGSKSIDNKFFRYISPINPLPRLAPWVSEFLLRACPFRRMALTHVCVLSILFRIGYIGQFVTGVVSHHKYTRPLRIVVVLVFADDHVLFDDTLF
jgi:hypothetical protein